MAKTANGYGSDPTVITDEKIEALCDAIKVGTSLAGAARWAGIAEDTLYRWMRLGRAPNPDEPYRALVEALDAALAYFEVSTVQELRSSEDMKSLRWLLAVRWPDRYTERKIVDGEVLHRHEFDFTRLEEGELETLRGLLAKAQPEGAPPVLELEPVSEEEGPLHETDPTVT